MRAVCFLREESSALDGSSDRDSLSSFHGSDDLSTYHRSRVSDSTPAEQPDGPAAHSLHPFSSPSQTSKLIEGSQDEERNQAVKWREQTRQVRTRTRSASPSLLDLLADRIGAAHQPVSCLFGSYDRLMVEQRNHFTPVVYSKWP
jgi:hypothetical protein